MSKYLKDSFDYSNHVLASSRRTMHSTVSKVVTPDRTPNSPSLWLPSGTITDHYGQLVEYVRLNGIVPPITQKYGLKVR